MSVFLCVSVHGPGKAPRTWPHACLCARLCTPQRCGRVSACLRVHLLQWKCVCMGGVPGPGSLHLPGSLHCLRPLCFENCAGRDFNSLLNPSVPARKGGKQRHGQEVTCPSLGKPFGFSAWKGRGGSHPIVTGDSLAPPRDPQASFSEKGWGKGWSRKKPELEISSPSLALGEAGKEMAEKGRHGREILCGPPSFSFPP